MVQPALRWIGQHGASRSVCGLTPIRRPLQRRPIQIDFHQPAPAANGAEKEDTFAADALLTTRSLSEVIADLRRVLSE